MEQHPSKDSERLPSREFRKLMPRSDREHGVVRRHWLIWISATLVLVLAVACIAYFSKESGAKIIELPRGARLIIPPGALADGGEIFFNERSQPDAAHDGMRFFGPAVELKSDPPDAIRGVMTLEFPIPVGETPQDIDPDTWFGVSTYDSTVNSWVPRTATYDASRHMIVALISHFSWWNPFSWDFGAVFNNVVQNVGELAEKRAPAPECDDTTPEWVGHFDGISDQDNNPVLACSESSGDTLTIKLVNNRAFGQVVHYNAANTQVSRGTPSELEGVVLSTLVDSMLDDGELYLPPLTRASLRITELPQGTKATYAIGPSVLTIGADMAISLLQNLRLYGTLTDKISRVPGLFKSCRVPRGNQRLTDTSPSALLEYGRAVFGCFWDGLKSDTDALSLSREDRDQLDAEGRLFAQATAKPNGIDLPGGYLWTFGDLVGDWLTQEETERGYGFEVTARPPLSPGSSAAPYSGRNTLHPGEKLLPGQALTSKNGRYTLVMQEDGNLVEYEDGRKVWASDTFWRGSTFEAQSDGNFVIYGPGHVARWATETYVSDSWMILQDDRNVVIVAHGKPVWATDTNV